MRERNPTALDVPYLQRLVSVLALSVCAPAGAAFHLFRINELYSSPDGTVQYMEIKESTGSDFDRSGRGKRCW